MELSSEKRICAKKVLFLYPHSVIQEQMLALLIQSEYEVALVNDHKKAMRLLNAYPSTILFCNIDDTHLKKNEWNDYLRDIIKSSSTNDARVGVLTYDPDPSDAQMYLMDIGIQCGYIGLKLGLKESTKIILKLLEANEAKGGRRFIRIRCPTGKSTLNMQYNGNTINATILDLSSAGLACMFTDPVPGMQAQLAYSDIQLQLWGARLKETLTLVGTRDVENGAKVHIFMFEDFSTRDSKAKLYAFIKKAIQAEIDAV
jgi:hypothetical protein